MHNEVEFDIGDKVSRKMIFSGKKEAKRFGVIYEVYESKQDWQGKSKKMYAVKWSDTGFVERGYLSNGLTLEN